MGHPSQQSLLRAKRVVRSPGALAALACFSVCLAQLSPLCVSAQLPPLIPSKIFLGNPARTMPQLSPDGTRLSYMAEGENGILHIFVQTLGKDDARQATHDLRREVRFYLWAADSQHILYEQDAAGDENYHIFSLALKSGQIRDLTPFVGVKAQNLTTSPDHPNEILVGMNLQNRQTFDMYRINLNTGAVMLDTTNPGDVLSWTVDPNFQIRAATAFDPVSVKTIVRVRDTRESSWRPVIETSFEESRINGQSDGGTIIAGFSPTGRTLYVVSGKDSDKTRLVEIDADSGKQLRVLAQQDCCDVADDNLPPWLNIDFHSLILFDHVRHVPEAVAFEYDKFSWQFIDTEAKKDFETIQNNEDGFFRVVSRDDANSKWLVAKIVNDGPQSFWLYDRVRKTKTFLFSDLPELANYKLAKEVPLEIKSRDGLTLVCYLTTPTGLKPKDLPLVVYPHGGPWDRDHWGYWVSDPMAQFLANRGYAVLQVNYRGSTGFGSAFLNASTHEWGLKTQDDISDAVLWMVNKGIADPHRVAIVGASGGGYAALRGVTTTPDLYACAVDIFGPSDLKTLFGSMSTWWHASKARWIQRVGDVERDEALNRRLSPLYDADKVKVPVLIEQGANDPRVSEKNSAMMVAALRARNIPVTYVVYPDEGHGFYRPENNVDSVGRIEVFLQKCLGGRAELIEKLPGSSVEVR
jgi:dipeptidyl aminopeptidase/acylaminoacyl peptidase